MVVDFFFLSSLMRGNQMGLMFFCVLVSMVIIIIELKSLGLVGGVIAIPYFMVHNHKVLNKWDWIFVTFLILNSFHR